MLAFCRSMSIGIRKNWVAGFVEVFLVHEASYNLVCIFIMRCERHLAERSYRAPLLKKTSLPWAALLLRQKLLLLPWHDAFVLIKMCYGLYIVCIICVRYTLVLEWYVDFVWFCVSLRHSIYKHYWYLGSWLDEFQLHIHTCYHQHFPKSKPRVSQKTLSFFDLLRFYRFGVLLVIIAKLWLYIIHLLTGTTPPRSVVFQTTVNKLVYNLARVIWGK